MKEENLVERMDYHKLDRWICQAIVEIEAMPVEEQLPAASFLSLLNDLRQNCEQLSNSILDYFRDLPE